jgi:hypothetical protein
MCLLRSTAWIFVCFVWIWEQTAIISLYSNNWLVFITKTECLLRGTDWVLSVELSCTKESRKQFYTELQTEQHHEQ